MSGRRRYQSKLDRDIDQAIHTNALARYRTLATRLETAARAWSWKGSAPPADWARLDANLHTTRANLEAFVKSLLPKEPEA